MTTDTYYHNGHIFTADDAAPWAEAMLVRDDKIVAIGSVEQVTPAKGDVRYDLEGQTVIPGIHDAHSHLIQAAMGLAGYSCLLDKPGSLDELREQLHAYWAHHADRGWLIGGIYNPFDVPVTKEWLDVEFPDIPVVLHDYSFHNVVVNTATLAASNITKDTEDPAGGCIERDCDTGEPTGFIKEAPAVWLVYRNAPRLTSEEARKTLQLAVSICNRYGITAVQEASANEELLEAAKHLADDESLTLDLICHIVWHDNLLAQAEFSEQERLIAQRRQYAASNVHVDAVKVFLDGTSMAPIFSHVPLDEETDEPILDHLLLDLPELIAKVEAWTRDGIALKAHCTGFGSVRLMLDCYEKARETTPWAGEGPKHEIAHAHYVSDRDLDRFAELDVVAEMSPAIWHIPEYQRALGKAYDFRTMTAHGALVTVGTDWLLPPTPNLFPALAGMLDHGDESVPIETAVKMMTINGAIAVGKGHQWGSLEAGKDATFVVLDRDIFDVEHVAIAETSVVSTVVRGKFAYRADVDSSSAATEQA